MSNTTNPLPSPAVPVASPAPGLLAVGGGFTKNTMQLNITLTMDNAAFFDDDRNESQPQRNAEVARILHTLAQRIANSWELEPEQGFVLMDTNGNHVGNATVTEGTTATPASRGTATRRSKP